MIQSRTRWELATWQDQDEACAKRLAESLKLSPLTARLLVQRGYKQVAQAKPFLYGGEEELHDPMLMFGMREAVERIQHAVDTNEKIRIYGDYDADGVSSTALLIRLFNHLNAQFDYYIPHRALEGYGLNRQAIALAAEAGVRLIVTVDTGISAYEEIEYAKELGIDVVVTDHHEPPERIPAACAVVNPKQKNCKYPFKGLAGVGVAFKLAHAILNRPPLEWADIVSLGTIADLMPLVDENRILVKSGLKQMRSSTSAGFRALAEVSNINLAQITSTNIAFQLAPKINAAGRLSHAGSGVELLTTSSHEQAIETANELDRLNKERQQIVDEIVSEAEQLWLEKRKRAEDEGKEAPSVIVLANAGWHVGVIGIVASKLLERHYKPVIIIGMDKETGMCKGSARSIEGFDLHAALTKCDELLEHYGGHQAAAGLTVSEQQIEPLENRLCQLALQWVTKEEWIPKTFIDLECSVQDATLETIEELALLEPFGMENASPKLLFKEAEIAESRAIGKESKHLKLLLRSGRLTLDGIGFNMGDYSNKLPRGYKINLIGELSVNEWNGSRKAQLQLIDLHRDERDRALFPTREQFGLIYKQLRQLGNIPLEGLAERLSSHSQLPVNTIILMLDVFEELQFIQLDSGRMTVNTSPQKKDLSASERYVSARQSSEQELA